VGLRAFERPHKENRICGKLSHAGGTTTGSLILIPVRLRRQLLHQDDPGAKISIAGSDGRGLRGVTPGTSKRAQLVADRDHARLRQRVRDSVTIDFDQTLVADSEVMRDLVEDDASHLAAEQLRVVSVETHERATVDRDLVRQHSAVVTAMSG
jgi:hypothetical protein